MIEIIIKSDSENLDELVRELISFFRNSNSNSNSNINVVEGDGRKQIDDLSAITIHSFKGFGRRVYKRLYWREINTLADLVKVEPYKILEINQIGPDSFKRIVDGINEWLVNYSNEELEAWVKVAERELD